MIWEAKIRLSTWPKPSHSTPVRKSRDASWSRPLLEARRLLHRAEKTSALQSKIVLRAPSLPRPPHFGTMRHGDGLHRDNRRELSRLASWRGVGCRRASATNSGMVAAATTIVCLLYFGRGVGCG